MKRIIIFSAVACSIAFYACKKDNNTTTPVTEDTRDTIDPIALSSAIKVGYATNIKGELPAASSSADAPVLSTIYDNRTYHVINGRYLVIYPQTTTGYVAGYYIKINGADSYFKVDYTKAFNLRKAPAKKGEFREDGDNADSSIVIKLPAGLKGDTFSVKYAAYDTLNNVSNALTALVNIVDAPDSANNDLVAGTWRIMKISIEGDQGEGQSQDANYKLDTGYSNFTCVNEKLQYCYDGNCMSIINGISGSTANDFVFAANSQFTYIQSYVNKQLNVNSSSCSTPVYDDYSSNNNSVGGYSYNPTTKMLTTIYDGDGKQGDTGASNIYTQTFTVADVSATTLALTIKVSSNQGRDNIQLLTLTLKKQ